MVSTADGIDKEHESSQNVIFHSLGYIKEADLMLIEPAVSKCKVSCYISFT